MILVVGALASGKRTFVRSLGYTDEQMGSALFDGRPVLCDLDELLHKEELDAQALDDLRSRSVVICNEVGMGVVPIDKFERTWRERVGHTCSQLAADADCVVRLVCGIPVMLKGEELV